MAGLRPIKIIRNYLKYPEGSCLIQMGNTKVLCTASISRDLPDHAKAQNKGWLTAEYSMLPRATNERTARGKIASGGRTKEISRLIGRSLRAVMDLTAIPETSLMIDCDVIQADGGTRTASINGGFIAAVEALRRWRKENRDMQWPVRDLVGAVSVGLVDGQCVLDLNYERDVRAEVDLNVVMTGSGHYVEIQGNAEHKPFSQKDLDRMLRVAKGGIQKILATQRKILGNVSR
jgi:ribonuclease PH